MESLENVGSSQVQQQTAVARKVKNTWNCWLPTSLKLRNGAQAVSRTRMIPNVNATIHHNRILSAISKNSRRRSSSSNDSSFEENTERNRGSNSSFSLCVAALRAWRGKFPLFKGHSSEEMFSFQLPFQMKKNSSEWQLLHASLTPA